MEGYRWKAAVITLSDKGYAGKREDRSGPLICEMIKEAGYDVEEMILLPDEKEERKKLRKMRNTVNKIFKEEGAWLEGQIENKDYL